MYVKREFQVTEQVLMKKVSINAETCPGEQKLIEICIFSNICLLNTNHVFYGIWSFSFGNPMKVIVKLFDKHQLRTWRRKWQRTPLLLPGESHGQRSLVGYSPWGRKESDTTERLHFGTFHLAYTLPINLNACDCICAPWADISSKARLASRALAKPLNR